MEFGVQLEVEEWEDIELVGEEENGDDGRDVAVVLGGSKVVIQQPY